MAFSALELFLMENPIDNIVEKVVISERFKNLPFKVRPLTNDEYAEINKRALKIDGKKVNFDTKKFNVLAAIECTIEPNFRSAEAIKAHKVSTPEQYISKVLLPGEIAALAEKISKISGFNQTVEDIEELKEEAKNS